MPLTYDFDMVAVTPEGLPDQFGDLTATGLGGEKRAMFRDPQTVAALAQADEAVRGYFLDSGFALTAHDSGAPPGRFPARDETARVRVIEKLSANLATHNLDGANWGGFEFPAFMQALSVAEPVEDELLAPPPRSSRPDPELAAAHEASRKLRARRMFALSGLTIGLILLVFAAGQILL